MTVIFLILQFLTCIYFLLLEGIFLTNEICYLYYDGNENCIPLLYNAPSLSCAAALMTLLPINSSNICKVYKYLQQFYLYQQLLVT